MKRIILTLLSILLIATMTSCSSGSKNLTNGALTSTETDYISESEMYSETIHENENKEEYEKGVFTEDYFYSKWLNLRFDRPSQFRKMDPELIEWANDPNGDEITEMYADFDNNEKSPYLQVTVKKNKNNYSVKEVADKLKQSLENSFNNLSSNGTYYLTWDMGENYNFLNEHYLMYHMHCSNNFNNRESDSWWLFRLKEDRIITISGGDAGNGYKEGDCTLEELLAFFKPYDNATNNSNDISQSDNLTNATTQKNTQTQTTAHQHSFVNHTGKAATCAESGYYDYQTCSCGYSDYMEIPALGHDYAPATCDAPKTCRRCGKTEGTKLSHNMDYTKCTRCGYTDFTGYTVNSNVFIYSSWYYNLSEGLKYLDNGDASISIDENGTCNVNFIGNNYTFTLKQAYKDAYGLHFDCYMNGTKLEKTEVTFFFDQDRCGFSTSGGLSGFRQVSLDFYWPFNPCY